MRRRWRAGSLPAPTWLWILLVLVGCGAPQAGAAEGASGRSLQRAGGQAERPAAAGPARLAMERARLELHLAAVDAGVEVWRGRGQPSALEGWRGVLERWLMVEGHDLDAEVRVQLALAGLDEMLLVADRTEAEPQATRRMVRVEPSPVDRRIARVPADVVRERELRRVAAPPAAERRTRRVGAGASSGGGERWALPIANPRVTSSWGPRVHPITGERGRMHHGVDYGAPTGTAVLASATGRVLVAGWCGSGAGNCVVLEHEGGWRTQYFHLSRWRVRAGEQVRQGDRIGDVGATGSATGPHLHFEIRRGQESVDPERWLGRPIR